MAREEIANVEPRGRFKSFIPSLGMELSHFLHSRKAQWHMHNEMVKLHIRGQRLLAIVS